MFEFRITKYDPSNRDSHGVYTRDEWTSVSDIGRAFEGLILTEKEYLRVEDAYATTAVALLRETGVRSLVVSGLENYAGVLLPFADGSSLALAEIDKVVRQLLRGEFWCRLKGNASFIHFGYDYYMYIGVSTACPYATELGRSLGLFLEPFRSPYRE